MQIATASDRTLRTRSRVQPVPSSSRLRGVYARGGKRVLAVLLVVLSAPITLPLLLVLALMNAVQLGDLGSAFCTQPRVGRNGCRFAMIKLRTQRGGRSTRFGALLRRTHLDELPQIWNVLRGDMCLVGPRPETVAMDAWAARGVPGFARRLALRPGLTGLAQIEQGHVGPDRSAYRDKLRLDDQYVARLSLTLDVCILLRTLPRLVRGGGA